MIGDDGDLGDSPDYAAYRSEENRLRRNKWGDHPVKWGLRVSMQGTTTRIGQRPGVGPSALTTQAFRNEGVSLRVKRNVRGKCEVSAIR